MWSAFVILCWQYFENHVWVHVKYALLTNREMKMVNCKYLIIHSLQGFSGIIYNTGLGTLPDCSRCSLQVIKEWVRMPPYPYMTVKVRWTTTTGTTCPTLYEKCAGSLMSHRFNYYMRKGLWDWAYGLSSLSEKTRKSNHLQMLLQRQHFLLSYLKTLSVGLARVHTYGLPLSRPVLIPWS